MSRDGTGTYNEPIPDVVTGATISAADYNTTMADIATALTGSLARDGQGGMLADLPMNNFSITGMGAPAANTSAARRRDLGAEWIATTAPGGTPSWIEFALSSAYSDFEFQFSNITPNANSAFLMMLSRDNGGTWLSGATEYVNGWYGSIAPGYGVAATASVALLSPAYLSNGPTPMRGLMRLNVAPFSTSARWTCETSGQTPTPAFEAATYHGSNSVGTTCNRVRFGWNGSTFANQGHIIQRGIRL